MKILLFVFLLLSAQLANAATVSAFNSSSVGKFTCGDSDTDVANSGALSITYNGTTYYTGLHQISSDNQNAIVRAIGTINWCKDDYETLSPDSKGIGLLYDDTNGLYAVFSIDGANNPASSDLRNYTGNGWITSYGSGGGPKVSVILKLDSANNGNVMQDGSSNYIGTYVIAKTSKGKTNTLVINNMYFSDGELKVEAKSWYSPLKPNQSRISVSGKSPFDYFVILDANLTKASDSGLIDSSSGSYNSSAPIDSIFWMIFVSLIFISSAFYFMKLHPSKQS